MRIVANGHDTDPKADEKLTEGDKKLLKSLGLQVRWNSAVDKWYVSKALTYLYLSPSGTLEPDTGWNYYEETGDPTNVCYYGFKREIMEAVYKYKENQERR